MHNIRRGKTAMDRKKEKLVIRGNEFYEIDLECIRRKQCSQEETKRKIPERFPNKESRVKGQLKK